MGLIILLYFTLTIFQIETKNNSENVSNCLNHIIVNEFSDGNSLLIVTNNTLDLSLINISYTIVHSAELLFRFEPYETYVISLWTIDAVENILNVIKRKYNLNPAGKFIILDFGVNTNLTKTFELLWTFNILRGVIVSKGNVYKYDPYGNCGRMISPLWVEACLKSINLFTTGVLNNCELKMLTVPIKPFVIDYNADRKKPALAGIEVTIMDAMAEWLKFSALYSDEQHDVFYNHIAKFEPEYGVQMLANREIDVIFGYSIATSESSIFDVCEHTLFHLVDQYSIWVPRAMKIPGWQNITKTFKMNIWILIVAVVMAVSLVIWIIGRCHNEDTSRYYNPIFSILSTFSILMQMSPSEPRSKLLRFVLVIWSCASVLLFTAYQSQLISTLMKPFYEHQISTIDELLESDLFISLNPSLQTFQVYFNETLGDRLVFCKTNEFCLNRTAFSRDSATTRGEIPVKFFMKKYYLDENGKPMIAKLKESSTIFLQYVLLRGHPFKDKFNSFLLRLNEIGLMKRWLSELQSMGYEDKHVNEKVPLTIGHLQAAFYLLILGELLASFVFLLEFFIN